VIKHCLLFFRRQKLLLRCFLLSSWAAMGAMPSYTLRYAACIIDSFRCWWANASHTVFSSATV